MHNKCHFWQLNQQSSAGLLIELLILLKTITVYCAKRREHKVLLFSEPASLPNKWFYLHGLTKVYLQDSLLYITIDVSILSVRLQHRYSCCISYSLYTGHVYQIKEDLNSLRP